MQVSYSPLTRHLSIRLTKTIIIINTDTVIRYSIKNDNLRVIYNKVRTVARVGPTDHHPDFVDEFFNIGSVEKARQCLQLIHRVMIDSPIMATLDDLSLDSVDTSSGMTKA